MLDLVYVLATVAFFALMLAYVRGCAALGRATNAPGASDRRSESHEASDAPAATV